MGCKAYMPNPTMYVLAETNSKMVKGFQIANPKKETDSVA
jgi:hypothetical protein